MKRTDEINKQLDELFDKLDQDPSVSDSERDEKLDEKERHLYDLQRREKLLSKCGLDAHYYNGGMNLSRQQKRAVDAVDRTLCKCKPPGLGAIFFFGGDRGTGKTEMASELIRRTIIDRGHYGNYTKLSGLLALRLLYSSQGFTEKQMRDAEKLRCRYTHYFDLLVIDEIHENSENLLSPSILTDLIDRRHTYGRNTILISNHDPEYLADSGINPSILDRMKVHGGTVSTVGWTNYRE